MTSRSIILSSRSSHTRRDPWISNQAHHAAADLRLSNPNRFPAITDSHTHAITREFGFVARSFSASDCLHSDFEIISDDLFRIKVVTTFHAPMQTIAFTSSACACRGSNNDNSKITANVAIIAMAQREMVLAVLIFGPFRSTTSCFACEVNPPNPRCLVTRQRTQAARKGSPTSWLGFLAFTRWQDRSESSSIVTTSIVSLTGPQHELPPNRSEQSQQEEDRRDRGIDGAAGDFARGGFLVCSRS